MSLRNENIGIAVGIAFLIVGLLVTGGDPDDKQGAVIGALVLGSALGVSIYLNERDARQSSRR